MTYTLSVKLARMTDPTIALARDEALAFAQRAEEALEHLHDLHANPPSDLNARAIGRTHQELGLALKLADVHATLAVAEQLQGLRADLLPDEPIHYLSSEIGTRP